MDEEIQEEQLNNEVEQPVEEVQETVEEAPEEVAEPETPEEPEEEEPAEERPPSRRENLRIQKLIEKMRESKPEAKPLELDGLDYSKTLDADPDVIAKLDEDRRNYGNQGYQRGLEEAKSLQFTTRLEIDAPKVMDKHPELNPENKEKFNPALSNALNSWYLNMSGYDAETGKVVNNNIRYNEFIDSVWELGNEIAGQKIEKSVKNVAKQAAATGLRPDGSSSKRLNLDQDVSTMSDEELEAYGKKLGLATNRR
jgi:hypothetical protein